MTLPATFAPPGLAVRETAEDRETAETRTFSEAEHIALLTDRVQRETATLTATIATLTTEKAELLAKLDVADAEKAAAITERDTAAAEVATIKAETARATEVAARVEARSAKVRELTPNLTDYVTPERASRWAEMDDATFEAFVGDLAAVSGKTVAPATPKVETAAFTGGTSPAAPDTTHTSKTFLALARAK